MRDDKENRYLRYIYGEKAVQFFELANMLQKIKNKNIDYSMFQHKVATEIKNEVIKNL